MEDLSGVSEPARWLPLFLKTRSVPGKILQASEWEWAHFVCQIIDYGRRPLDAGQVHINPSMQFIELHEAVPDLRRDPGLYGIFVFAKRVHSRQFALAEALLLETLHEDRKFSRAQLIEAARIEAESWPQLRAVDWDSLLNDMTAAGVLTEGPAASTPGGKT